MRPFILTILLGICLNTNAQTKKYAFANTGFNNNVLLFEKVKDTLLLLRSTDEGMEWNLFDTSLNLVHTEILNTKIGPQVLIQQLQVLPDKMGYIKQRVYRNSFDITVNTLSLAGEKKFEGVTSVYSEPYDGRAPIELKFENASSPKKNYILLYRPIKDSTNSGLNFKLIVLDKDLSLIAENTLSVPIQPQTGTFYGIGINEAGEVYALSGETFDSYVLGTNINISVFESASGKKRTGLVKLPKQKIKDLLLDVSHPDLFRLYTITASSNVDKYVDGVTTIDINKQNFSTTISESIFEKSFRVQLKRIINNDLKSILNQSQLIAAVNAGSTLSMMAIFYPKPPDVPIGRTFSTPAIPSGVEIGDDIRRWTQINSNYLRTATLADIDFANRQRMDINSIQNVSRQAFTTPSFSRYPRSSGNNQAMALIWKKKDSLSAVPIYREKLAEELQLPKLFFIRPDKIEMVHAAQTKGKYYIAKSIISDEGIQSTTVIENTKNLIIDRLSTPIQIGSKNFFVYRNIETRGGGIMLLE